MSLSDFILYNFVPQKFFEDLALETLQSARQAAREDVNVAKAVFGMATPVAILRVTHIAAGQNHCPCQCPVGIAQPPNHELTNANYPLMFCQCMGLDSRAHEGVRPFFKAHVDRETPPLGRGDGVSRARRVQPRPVAHAPRYCGAGGLALQQSECTRPASLDPTAGPRIGDCFSVGG